MSLFRTTRRRAKDESRSNTQLEKLLAELPGPIQHEHLGGNPPHTREDFEASRRAIRQKDGTCCRPGCSKKAWKDKKKGLKSAFCSAVHANSYGLGFKLGSDPTSVPSRWSVASMFEDGDSNDTIYNLLVGQIKWCKTIEDLKDMDSKMNDLISTSDVSLPKREDLEALYNTRFKELNNSFVKNGFDYRDQPTDTAAAKPRQPYAVARAVVDEDGPDDVSTPNGIAKIQYEEPICRNPEYSSPVNPMGNYSSINEYKDLPQGQFEYDANHSVPATNGVDLLYDQPVDAVGPNASRNGAESTDLAMWTSTAYDARSKRGYGGEPTAENHMGESDGGDGLTQPAPNTPNAVHILDEDQDVEDAFTDAEPTVEQNTSTSTDQTRQKRSDPAINPLKRSRLRPRVLQSNWVETKDLVLGKGKFGVVRDGTFNDADGESVRVAVKMVHDNLGPKETMKEHEDMIREAKVMAQFEHENVVRLIGIVLPVRDTVPCQLIVSFCEKGSLDRLLRDKTNAPSHASLWKYTSGIAAGMAHLHHKKFVHRDLAARNILIDSQNNPKVADFGLSRGIRQALSVSPSDSTRQSGCYEMISTGTQLPVRWLAPETLSMQRKRFSEKSDVWAYGITIIEIYSQGAKPYSTCKNEAGKPWGNLAVIVKVNDDHFVHPRPPHCPERIYCDLVLQCLSYNKNDRPRFAEICVGLEEMSTHLEFDK